MYQLAPVKISQKKFAELPLRDDVKGEKYDADAMYRSSAYPDAVFIWKPFDKEYFARAARDAETLKARHGIEAPAPDAKGEWLMAKAEIAG